MASLKELLPGYPPASLSRRKTLQEDLFLSSFELYNDLDFEYYLGLQLPYSGNCR